MAKINKIKTRVNPGKPWIKSPTPARTNAALNRFGTQLPCPASAVKIGSLKTLTQTDF